MKRILIIGGGVAGLSAGIFARLNGFEACIFERGEVAGGNLTGWQRGEYHIDNCIHWLTGTNPNSTTYRLWEELGVLGEVEVIQSESLYTCEVAGERLALWRDLDRLEREMLALSPEDARHTRAFCADVRTAQRMLGIGGTGRDQKSTAAQNLRAMPRLLRYSRLDVGSYAARFRHPLLRSFLTSLLTPRFGVLALFCVFAHYTADNGGIPRGSSRGMAERMVERFLALGGELYLKKEAVRILREGREARAVLFADGTREEGDYVVLTSDPAVSFGRLLDVKMPVQLERLYHSPRHFRFSGYHCAFACATRELPFRGDFITPLSPNDQAVLGTRDLILREFSHEPSFAPAGHSILQTMAFCDEEQARDFIALRRTGEAYARRKKEIAAHVERLICAQFPQLAGKLTLLDVWTPATYHRYVGSEIGSYMGFAFEGGVLPLAVSNRVRGLRNVVLATQWLQAPGGLPIAAKSGKQAIAFVLRREGQAQQRSAAKLQAKTPAQHTLG